MSPTCILFTTLHCVHVSPMSLTYVPITVQRNYLPYKRQPGNAQFSCSLVMPYFSESLGAWAPLPNTSTTLSHNSPPRHGCWCPMHPFRGFCLNSPVFRINYIQCITVLVQLSLRPLRHVYHLNYSMYYMYMYYVIGKSPTPPTCVLF